jgi:hypothetical protein
MTSKTAETVTAGKSTTMPTTMSRVSMAWDQSVKGYLTGVELITKNMDVGGKGHLSL